jgi:formylglycine-generating enzyme
MRALLWAALCCSVLSVTGATGETETGFYRIQSPGLSRFIELESSGKVVWSNALVGSTGVIQKASALPASEDQWVDVHAFTSTNATMTAYLIHPDMVLIPAGSFQMGDDLGDGWTNELPVHTVYVSAFYMDKYEVTKAQWDEVYSWAISNGYNFDNAGSGKAADHPVHTVNWYDVVKWCNARSEKEGRTPAYYTSSTRTSANIYRTGQVNVENDWVRWDSGYRLPTEAEWEKAARGGLSGQRFPWGANINHDYANYCANGSAYTYDTSPYTSYTYHPDYDDGGSPYTSPVGEFAANGYGLYDMAGNVWEWCWDWYGNSYYGSSPGSDPRGPTSGSRRVVRGGGWGGDAYNCRVANRYNNYPDYHGYGNIGFRVVLPGQ